MQGFFSSFLPLLKQYKLESVFITISLLIALFSAFIFIKSSGSEVGEDTIVVSDSQPQQLLQSALFVEISGAVGKPNVYEVTPGARLKDVLIMANGLSFDADHNYFARNFNLARFVTDQEKIHVPRTWEIYSGIFTESPRILNYLQPQSMPLIQTTISLPQQEKMNINEASFEELKTIEGIGSAIAEKIIRNRPYNVIEEMVSKKVLTKTLFEKIKQKISVH